MSLPLLVTILISTNAICFFLFSSLRPNKDSDASRRLGFITCCLVAAVLQMTIAFGLYVILGETSMLAVLWAFSTWTLGVSLILWVSGVATFIKIALFPFLILGPILMGLHPDGIAGFAAELDQFVMSVSSAGEPNVTQDVVTSSANPQVTPSAMFRGLIAFLHTFLVTSCYASRARYFYETRVEQKDERGPAFESEALQQVVYLLSFSVALIVGFVAAGGNGIGLGVFSGFIAVALSVALHDMLQNFVAGLIMLGEKSIRIGDVISLGETGYGFVKKITLRCMVVVDRDDITTMIPHSRLINSDIENWTIENGNVRLKLDIGVAYDSDLAKVKEIMKSVHLKVDRVLAIPAPAPTIMATDESSIHIQLRFRISDPKNGIRNVMSQVYEVLLKRFKEEGIEIPFPQRVVHHRSAESATPYPPIRVQLDDPSKNDKNEMLAKSSKRTV